MATNGTAVEACCLCDKPLPAGVVGVHPECAYDYDNDPKNRCSRCGDDPNWCPCTTGWDSVGGMRW